MKHSSKLVRVWPRGAHEKEDGRDDAWGAVAASVEEGDGDDGRTATKVTMAMAATASWSYFCWAQSLLARSQLQRMRVTRWLLASGGGC